LDAADYFIPKYWIWAKLIENLAEIGYDSNNMYFASFDWRLSYANMEKRDGMLSRLKLQVEHLTKMTGEKAVIVCHSMGANVFEYFMHWVESPAGANAGEDWVSKHIEAVVNIAGPMLGVSKTLSSLISGEQRETVQPLADYMLEHFLNKHERARIFRSWGGLPSLLPKGGNAVWGDLDYAPDDVVGPRRDGADSYGAMIRFADGKALGFERNLTAEDALDMLVHTLDPRIRERMLNEYSFGAFTTEADMQQHRLDHRMWTNSLQSQLPRAPDMKIYCIYGVGIETERSYYYERLTGSQIRRSERQQEESIGREREKLLKVRSGLSTSDSHTRRLLIKGAMADEVDRHKDHGPVSTLRIDTCQSNPEEFTSSGIVTTDG
ncbi:phospholipid:diacylglycerol acyltransferase, partial [Spiromyces aspiralis]